MWSYVLVILFVLLFPATLLPCVGTKITAFVTSPFWASLRDRSSHLQRCLTTCLHVYLHIYKFTYVHSNVNLHADVLVIRAYTLVHLPTFSTKCVLTRTQAFVHQEVRSLEQSHRHVRTGTYTHTRYR